MINKQRFVALMLLLLLLLSGCGRNLPQQTTSAPTEASLPEMTVSCQLIPQTVENPGDLPVLKWVCLVDDATVQSATEKIWTTEVGAAINQALVEKELPFRLQIVLLTSKGFFNDWLANPTAAEYLKSADLIYGFFYPDQAAAVFQPITEYLIGENAPLSGSVADEIYWKTDMSGGEVYGIQGTVSLPLSLGWICSEAALKASGLSMDDLSCPYWQMDAAFSKIYQANQQRPFLYIDETGVITNDMIMTCLPASLTNYLFYRYQWVTSCYSIDYSLKKPAVINSLDTGDTRSFLAAIQQYRSAGYTFTDGEDGQMLMNYEAFVAQTPYVLDELCYIPIEQAQYMTTYGNFLNGVAKDSQQREAAVALLELIAKDHEFRRLLCFGRDGKEYAASDSDSFYNMQFLSGLSDFSGLDTGLNIPQAEGKEPLDTYQNMMDNAVIRYPLFVGYGFDISEIRTEIETVNRMIENNADKLLNMSAEEYDQFVLDICNAGGDKILAELQRQLDAWLAANPDWDK